MPQPIEKSIDELLEDLQNILGQLGDNPAFDGAIFCVMANSDTQLFFSEEMVPHTMIGLLETAKFKVIQDFIGKAEDE